MKLIHTFIVGLFVLGCGSKVSNNSNHEPVPPEVYDPAKVQFVEVSSGKTVILSEELKKDYALLYFGSVTCSSCGQKAEDWKKAQPVLAHFSQRLELHAAYIDADLNEIKQYKEKNGYDFLTWQDIKAQMLRRFFLPADLCGQLMVPVTVLVQKEPPKLVASWSPSGPYTVEQIILAIGKLIPQDGPTPTPTPTPDPTPTPTPTPEVKDFSFYPEGQELKVWWGNSKMTIVSLFGDFCPDCWAEMKSWSSKDGLVDFCKTNGKCSVYAVEVTSIDGTIEDKYQKLKQKFSTEGVTVGLAVAPDKQYFDYLNKEFPNFDGYIPATVIYDETGKIIFSEGGQTSDYNKVFEYVKTH